MANNDSQNAILQFKKTHFLATPQLPFRKKAVVDHLQNSAAAALFYFFSNQYANITAEHIRNVNALFTAAQKNVGAFMAAATVKDAEAAIRTEKSHIDNKRLAMLIRQCRQEDFAVRLVAAATANDLRLPSPFSEQTARCQESYEVKNGVHGLSGMNCLRFTEGEHCFFLMQFASSADGLYFPDENLLVCLAHVDAGHVRFLQRKLLGDFANVLAYAQASTSFFGMIASHYGAFGHFYYENFPVLMEIYQQPDLYQHIPHIIMRKGYDFNDLHFLFGGHNPLLLDSEEIDHIALNGHNWFIFAGTGRHLRHTTVCYETADRHLVDKVTHSPTVHALEKMPPLQDCYPIVWIGVEGQKRCWLEQVDGYSYIIDQLAQRYPQLGVVIDGWTAPFSPSQRTLIEAQKDRQIALQIIRKIKHNVPHVLLMGENSNTKITIGNKIDFFICNFATGSLHVSRLLGKPGFCHLSGELSANCLRLGIEIHPNKNVFLLPKKYVRDCHNRAFSYLETAKKYVYFAVNRFILGNRRPLKQGGYLGRLSYSIDKQAFYQFIEQRLEKVLINAKPKNITFFIEPWFSIHWEVRNYLKMASYGKLLEVFPTLNFPKKLADLSGFSEQQLKQNIIYGVFPFGSHVVFNQPSEFMVWLREPLERMQLHALQFAKNAVRDHQPSDMSTILKAGHKDLDNFYVRLISGLDAPFGKCTEALLDTAINNLRQFIFIGLNEHQAESFDRLCAQMDWDRSLFPDTLPNGYGVDYAQFSDEHLEMSQALIEFDLRLYQAALDIINGNGV